MKAAALSLAEIDLTGPESYRAGLSVVLKNCAADLVVLPAYSALALGLGSGAFLPGPDLAGTLYVYSADCQGWNELFLDLHSELAREHKIFLSAGTTVEKEGGSYYHAAYCFNPAGELCCRQRQTHLTKLERELDFSRGEELYLFDLPVPAGESFKTALVVGNDARHPEVGRILALRGADILLHSGALPAGFNCWAQAAGMWAQVQQNQLWAVEAQLSGSLAGRLFGAGCAVIGPCDLTPDNSGYLARGNPETPAVSAALNEAERQKLKLSYPLLELLNRQAFPELMQ